MLAATPLVPEPTTADHIFRAVAHWVLAKEAAQRDVLLLAAQLPRTNI